VAAEAGEPPFRPRADLVGLALRTPPMLNSLAIKGVGPPPGLDIEFQPRLNFLTGDNGLGKTFLLDIAWWALTRTWAKLPALPNRDARTSPRGTKSAPQISFAYRTKSKTKFEYASKFERAEQRWSVKQGRPPIPGLVIYAQVDGGFSAWDPARNYWKGKEPDQPGRPQAFVFKLEEVWDGLPIESPKKLCNGLILDWANWQREGGEAFHELTQVLKALSPSPDESLEPGKLTRIGLEDVRDQPTLHLPYGQDVPLVAASAGMRRIVALGYLLVWTWREHLRASELLGTDRAKEIIFLIDEIEAHLHPQWQRRIVNALLNVMEALTGKHSVPVQLIVTTHSPLVLASVEPTFDPKKDVIWDLDLVDSQVSLSKFPWRRLGSVDNWLTSTVFDLSEPRGYEAETVLDRALELLARVPQPRLEEFEKVDVELRRILGDTDPFWVRWSQNLERIRSEA
jgi:hypothetical protein